MPKKHLIYHLPMNLLMNFKQDAKRLKKKIEIKENKSKALWDLDSEKGNLCF